MFYEVFIPAKDSEDFDITITVEAGNWMVALKSGLTRTGQLGEGIRNVMCDIKDDNSIHVTDGTSRRVFVLKEVSDPDGGDAVEEKPSPPAIPTPDNKIDPPKAKTTPTFEMPPPTLVDEGAKTAPMEAIVSEEPSAKNVTIDLEPVVEKGPPKVEKAPVPTPDPKRETASNVTISMEPEPEPKSAPAPTAEPEPEKEPKKDEEDKIEADFGAPEVSLEEKSYTSPNGRISIGSATYDSLKRDESDAKILRESRAPSGTRPAVKIPSPSASVSQNILEDVFLRMQQIHEGMEMEEVIEFVMNISMEKIRAEAGSIMFADLSGTELYFAAARGPKADDIMDFRIPMGVGIVGFCVREGVSLALSDVEKDPRFYKKISEKLGYQTRNLCCVPIQHEGRVYGAIELMNKLDVFNSQEVNALTYIGTQMAKFIHDLIMAQEKI